MRHNSYRKMSGGPYISLEVAQKLLVKWLKSERIFGRIELEVEDGQIFRIAKHQTLKRCDLERMSARS